MGNVAIAFVNSTVALNEFILSKYNARLEHKRIASLIPRYLSQLNQSDSTITTLNLNSLGVDCTIVKKFESPLLTKDGIRVEELYLEQNWIGSEGATCVARILSRDKCLKIVSLANNPIGTMGAMALASAIESNSTLEKLNLSYCNINDAGVQKLACSLKKNTTLKYLYLEGNPISSEGINSLFKSIYDTSNGITSLWECNHTIRAFHNGITNLYSPSFPETEANRLRSQKLEEILASCNRRTYSSLSMHQKLLIPSSKHIAASRKILRYFFKDDPSQYMSTLENTEEKLVPHVMQWLGRYGDVGIIYDVVRDMPWLLEQRVHTAECARKRKRTADLVDVFPPEVGEDERDFLLDNFDEKLERKNCKGCSYCK
ncbi:hypothetical protein HJC23_006651 [Cyclotella cryptica]|uniref:Uncharacterized protein n=1 Tax=Cyclotella cryptica TaxID=29204 RepID=A0ABD3QWP6_9STRA|eukprot:CCRYP_001077-RA/>CCRYP_001077-RA protein AED:0.26 eAED:0.32 QI:0/-1/0/1/-1/1/1/0/372